MSESLWIRLEGEGRLAAYQGHLECHEVSLRQRLDQKEHGVLRGVPTFLGNHGPVRSTLPSLHSQAHPARCLTQVPDSWEGAHS